MSLMLIIQAPHTGSESSPVLRLILSPFFCSSFSPLSVAAALTMKMLVALLLLLELSNALERNGEEQGRQCNYNPKLEPRPHSVSISEFGAVGDGRTLNTIAFQNAIFYLKSFADKGGAQLYIPAGKWLTGSFNLTSHLTLFLEKGAVILGSQDPSHWDILKPLPSYGRGIELLGERYGSLINGYDLHDVVITGDSGTIDGQGLVWWNWFSSSSLNYSRPHLVELVSSEFVVVSNLTFLNPPSYTIHSVYCSHVHVYNISISAPPESPYTYGLVPDSCDNVCIEDCKIEMGYDSIALKSGWDEYGISYGRPVTNINIRRVHLRSGSGSSVAFGDEMSGGISNVQVEQVHLYDSYSGLEFRTTKGRGGYIEDIILSDVQMDNIVVAFSATGQSGSHPDDKFDPNALPRLDRITIRNVIGNNITVAGNFTGIQELPFTSLCLSNISLSMSADSGSSSSWVCSYVSGFSESVFPLPCPQLDPRRSNSSSSCFSLLRLDGKAAAL